MRTGWVTELASACPGGAAGIQPPALPRASDPLPSATASTSGPEDPSINLQLRGWGEGPELCEAWTPRLCGRSSVLWGSAATDSAALCAAPSG